MFKLGVAHGCAINVSPVHNAGTERMIRDGQYETHTETIED